MDVYEAIRTRRSVRQYDPNRPVPADVVQRLSQAMRYAPSACNYQPWHFIWVTDAELRQRLAAAANQQHWMADAPLTLVACGLADRAYPRMGGHHNSVDIDVAIAMDHLTLAAVAERLGTCWIGAFDEATIKDALGVPGTVKVVAMTPVGHPATAKLIHPVNDRQRKPLAEIVSTTHYGGPGDAS